MHGPITARIRIYDVAPGGLARHPDRLIEQSDRLQEPLVRLPGCPRLRGKRGAARQVANRKMWPVAIVLIAVVLFFWLAFCVTVWAWLQTSFCLFEGKFIRAAIWFNVG